MTRLPHRIQDLRLRRVLVGIIRTEAIDSHDKASVADDFDVVPVMDWDVILSPTLTSVIEESREAFSGWVLDV